jgi:hypothetical protein
LKKKKLSQKENWHESTDDTDFSMYLQNKSEQAGKKKTPMCLVDEVPCHHEVTIFTCKIFQQKISNQSRLNFSFQIQPEYCLTEESGPAHQKTFVVNLKLGKISFKKQFPYMCIFKIEIFYI